MCHHPNLFIHLGQFSVSISHHLRSSSSTVRIDGRLGFFQENFKLTGDEVRYLATKRPRLITSKIDNIKVECIQLDFFCSELY